MSYYYVCYVIAWQEIHVFVFMSLCRDLLGKLPQVDLQYFVF